jgi:CTP:molybdopterin cytidylyltransferase MocA
MNRSNENIAAIILAAGYSSRMGDFKPLYIWLILREGGPVSLEKQGKLYHIDIHANN